MYELLKADSKIRISEELVDNFKEINASLAEARGLALRQPIAVRSNDGRKLPCIWLRPHD